MATLHLIAGPESSGNRLLASILVAAGCYGEGSTRQPTISDLPDDRPSCLIMHYPEQVATAIGTARARGLNVHVLVTTRDWHCTIQSGVDRGHWPDPLAASAALGAHYLALFAVLAGQRVGYTMVSYEALCQHREGVTRWLLRRLGLPDGAARAPLTVNLAPDRDVYDGNARWFADEGDLIIRGYQGLGDNIYQRPFVRAQFARYRRVWLQTPWPQLYWDLAIERGLRFIPPISLHLRTQRRNVEALPEATWTSPPARAREVRIGYGVPQIREHGSIVRVFEHQLGLHGTRYRHDLPIHPDWDARLDQIIAEGVIAPEGRPIALVRPATLRREWTQPARNPRQEYLQALVDELAPTHYIVAIADLEDGEEWLDGPDLERVDRRLYGAELSVETIVALMARADVTIGGVGFIVPMGLALRARTFIVYGGGGGTNRPAVVTDPRMDLSRFGWVAPEPLCDCVDPRHACNKTIDRDRLLATFRAFMERC